MAELIGGASRARTDDLLVANDEVTHDVLLIRFDLTPISGTRNPDLLDQLRTSNWTRGKFAERRQLFDRFDLSAVGYLSVDVQRRLHASVTHQTLRRFHIRPG